MTRLSVSDIRNGLAKVINPKTGRSIIAEGRIDGLSVSADGGVHFVLDALDDAPTEANALLEAARQAVVSIAGVTTIKSVATRHQSAQRPAPAPIARPSGGHANPLGLTATTAPQRFTDPAKKRERITETMSALSGVGKVIAIVSGKGGVGKSTLTASLAVALARTGLRVGLLDADIYGPSLPTLLGLTQKPPMRDGKIVPFDLPQANGGLIRAMSIGFLVDPEQALAWRGPMVMGAVRQLINDVDWGELDVMLIDTPPGTGDAHLTLIQSGVLSGAVIVTTPQKMALADVKRGIALFEKTKIPILGLVENMAWLEMPDGTRNYIFGERGGEQIADELGIAFLGPIPLEPTLREACDAGTIASPAPIPRSAAFGQIAAKIFSRAS